MANKEREKKSSGGPKVIRTRLLANSWRVKFFEETVISKKGKPHSFARYEIPDFVVAVVKRSDGKIPLVRQYRNGARAMFWELPAGLVEPNEKLVDCVKREFQEETGFELKRPCLIDSIFTAPTRTSQRAHIFAGYVGEKVGKQTLDETEDDLKVKFVGEDQAFKLLSRRASSTHLLAYLLSRHLAQSKT